ncbi:flocculation protein FLO11 isoform X1 [Ostrinia furnacalis]|uniref:flocculation protein FLO11 isoform X1 n=1 Tax=Ostrinia furnacalis TaxID=93504 RepID=UPI001038BC27|nr:flocculation protein FLO11 isoform X1 [Ostrinia furnacalis]XP_028178822.1 flocculation protein FLO11 isoform X1 [Ostrinia furnacalis]
MATKSYSKHKEYKEYSSSGNIPYTDEQFDMLKSDLIPKGSKLDSFGTGGGAREYHYEYKEEKHPSGKYDRKDLHTVEQYTIPPKTVPKASESSSYYYEREERELPAITTGTRTYNYESNASSTPGYSKVKSSKVTKELSQNVDELDSLLDDLQKDQERQLYKSGYTSDTAESTSFDYKRGTPAKAPSSGYSTLKREERLESSSWAPSPPPVARTAELRQEVYREEKTESRVVPSQVSPALPLAVPQPVCSHCHHSTGTLSRSSTPMNKVTTTVKTYTYEVPCDQDPASVPLPPVADHQHTYVSSADQQRYVTSSTSTLKPAPSPAPGGCQYCSHCNRHVREFRQVTSNDEHTSERMVYPAPANETTVLPSGPSGPSEPRNGHGPYGPSSYKYSETSYSSHNTTQRFPASPPLPATTHLSPAPSPAPFPRPATPSAGTQQPPKKLDDLLADFPEAVSWVLLSVRNFKLEIINWYKVWSSST